MYKVGDDLKFISSVVKKVKVRFSKIVEIEEDDKGKIIKLQNAMKLRFVSTRDGSLWDTYRLISNGDTVLVEKPD
jgi:hypothetical protein